MLLNSINAYDHYVHIETRREVEVLYTDAQIKTESGDDWHTAVVYKPMDNETVWFAVPIDVFRRKFKERS